MITWNEKASQFISPLNRHRIEQNVPAKMDGKNFVLELLATKITIDPEGGVWFHSGEHKKLVGEYHGKRDLGSAPEAETAPSSASSPPKKSTKRAPSPKAKRKK